MAPFTLPGLDDQQVDEVRTALQERLVALIDTALTLKHIHWNVTGPTFIGVHEMLDPQVAGVNEMVDAIAERIAAMGGSPNGLPGNLVTSRAWDDYGVDRAPVPKHLEALDVVYSAVIAGACFPTGTGSASGRSPLMAAHIPRSSAASADVP